MRTSRRPWIAVWIVAQAALAVACGSSGGSGAPSSEDASGEASADAWSAADASSGTDSASGTDSTQPEDTSTSTSDGSGSDATVQDVAGGGSDAAEPDASADAGVEGSGGEAAADSGAGAVDAAADASDACAQPSINADNVIYVAPGGTDGSACGSAPSSPCATLGAAVASAHFMVRGLVLVAPGTYVEEVSLTAGVTVQGGWQVSGTTWTYDCDPSARTLVTIQAPASANITVLADALGGSASLSRVTVLSKATANTGESLFGVVARGSTTHLELDDVAVSVSAGGDGSSGDAGAPGSPPSSSCAASDGFDASAGDAGAPGLAGAFGATGYSATPGGAGAVAPGGHGGTAGGDAGASVPYCPCGSSSLFCLVLGSYRCSGSNGYNGCGGGGGGGGMGGGGGGSSVALYSYGAPVVVYAGSFSASNGGMGGPGGTGGPGAAGTAGATGLTGSCSAQVMDGGVPVEAGPDGAPVCTLITVDGGSPGGPGGSGGPGGQGGGGTGGSSYAIVGANGATVQLNGSPQLAHGTAGTSLGNGPAGVAANEASF